MPGLSQIKVDSGATKLVGETFFFRNVGNAPLNFMSGPIKSHKLKCVGHMIYDYRSREMGQVGEGVEGLGE